MVTIVLRQRPHFTVPARISLPGTFLLLPRLPFNPARISIGQNLQQLLQTVSFTSQKQTRARRAGKREKISHPINSPAPDNTYLNSFLPNKQQNFSLNIFSRKKKVLLTTERRKKKKEQNNSIRFLCSFWFCIGWVVVVVGGEVDFRSVSFDFEECGNSRDSPRRDRGGSRQRIPVLAWFTSAVLISSTIPGSTRFTIFLFNFNCHILLVLSSLTLFFFSFHYFFN